MNKFLFMIVFAITLLCGCTKNIKTTPFTMPKDEPIFPDDYGIKIIYKVEF